MQNLSGANEFYLHENRKNHFHINGLRQVGNNDLFMDQIAANVTNEGIRMGSESSE